MNRNRSASVRPLWVAVAVLVLSLGAAVATGMWVLTAVAIGLLFGFFLQKGDLCGASAFSEVVLMKDGRKVWGLWVCIVAGMCGFAVLDVLGWVVLNPKPLVWANYVIGGVLFGVGMVLAGGCASGCLFKAGAGNLNSIVALLGIALGVALVAHGPLSPLQSKLKTMVIKAPGGGSVTLSSLTGLPFWTLAAGFAAATAIVAIVWISRHPRPASGSKPGRSWGVRARAWKPWQAGLLIGILGAFAYLSSAASGRNYPLGVTGGVLHAQLLLTDTNLKHVYTKAAPATVPKQEPRPAAAAQKKVSWWLVLLVASLVMGSWVSGRASGEARLLPKPPGQVLWALAGGLLVGAGAAIATGCVIGSIVSGWALMSVGNVLFAAVVILANWATTYVYLMGGPRLQESG